METCFTSEKCFLINVLQQTHVFIYLQNPKIIYLWRAFFLASLGLFCESTFIPWFKPSIFDVPSPEQCWFSVSCIFLDILIGKEGLEFTKKYPIIYATDNSYEKKRWSVHVCQTLVIMFTLVIAIVLLFLLPVSLKISGVSGCLAFE